MAPDQWLCSSTSRTGRHSPVREEDSPGNYILRKNTNGVEFVWFDANGGEQLLDKRK